MRSKVNPRLITIEFMRLHHFHVVNQETGECFGMFASLYCAAQTAIDRARFKKLGDKVAVFDEAVEVNYPASSLKALQLSDMPKVNFEIGAPLSQTRNLLEMVKSLEIGR